MTINKRKVSFIDLDLKMIYIFTYLCMHCICLCVDLLIFEVKSVLFPSPAMEGETFISIAT